MFQDTQVSLLINATTTELR